MQRTRPFIRLVPPEMQAKMKFILLASKIKSGIIAILMSAKCAMVRVLVISTMVRVQVIRETVTVLKMISAIIAELLAIIKMTTTLPESITTIVALLALSAKKAKLAVIFALI